MPTKVFKVRVNVEDKNCDTYDSLGVLRQEIIDVKVPVKSAVKWRAKGGFAMVSLVNFEKLGRYGLTAEQYNVLVTMIGGITWNNRASLTQQELADKLGIDKPRANKAIKALCEKRIIKKTSQPGKVNIYEFNHQLVVVGDQARERSNQGIEFTY